MSVALEVLCTPQHNRDTRPPSHSFALTSEMVSTVVSPRITDILSQIATQCNVPISAIEDAYPTTDLQAAQFAITTASPRQLYSNFIFKVSEEVACDAERLRRTFKSMYQRNATLRSRIVRYNDGEGKEARTALAVIRQELPWTDFTDLDTYCQNSIGDVVNYGDNINNFALAADRKHFVWTIHHALYDGWSLALLWKEIYAIWLNGGETPSLPERPMFSRLVRFIKQPVSEDSTEYWKKHLSGYKGPVFPAYDREPKHDVRIEGEIRHFLPHNHALSISARLQTAWICTLMALSDTTDLLLLMASTGRNCPVPGVEELIGLCICGIPLRIQADLNATLRNMVERVQQTHRESIEHEHSGYSSFVSQVEESRRPPHIFNLKGGEIERWDFPGMQHQESNELLPSPNSWEMNMSMDGNLVSWNLAADSTRVGRENIQFMGDRFSKLLCICLSMEGDLGIKVGEVVKR
jgi:hypothetical protein